MGQEPPRGHCMVRRAPSKVWQALSPSHYPKANAESRSTEGHRCFPYKLPNQQTQTHTRTYVPPLHNQNHFLRCRTWGQLRNYRGRVGKETGLSSLNYKTMHACITSLACSLQVTHAGTNLNPFSKGCVALGPRSYREHKY